MTPADVFDFLNNNTTETSATIPDRICLEVGSLGEGNPIHFFKHGKTGRFRRFTYDPFQNAIWNLRKIVQMDRPRGGAVATYHVDVLGNKGSYEVENPQQGGNNAGYWPLNPGEVGAVITQYETLRTGDILVGAANPRHRQAGWYNQPNWPAAPGMISSPYVAALIVRFHDLNLGFWTNPVAPLPVKSDTSV
jgi:hypothetical protein